MSYQHESIGVSAWNEGVPKGQEPVGRVALRLWQSVRKVAADESIGGERFVEGAYVPSGFVSSLKFPLKQVGDSPPWMNVWTFSMPSEPVKELRSQVNSLLTENGWEGLFRLADGDCLIALPELTPAVQSLTGCLMEKFRIDAETMIVESVNVSRRNCYTGWRADKQRMIGLHLDSWEGGGIADRRDRSRMRVSVNIGSNDRLLYIVPNGLSGLAHALRVPDSRSTSGAKFAHDVRDAALANNPSILEITIPPGFGYVAMTDYLIHDGKAISIETPDIRFDVRADLRRQLEECAGIAD